MLVRVLILTLALTDAAVAQDAPERLAEQIAQQVASCWNLLPSEMLPENKVVIRVELDSTGEVVGWPEIVEQPTKRGGAGIGRAAQRAVASCGPYPQGFGTLTLTMIPDQSMTK